MSWEASRCIWRPNRGQKRQYIDPRTVWIEEEEEEEQQQKEKGNGAAAGGREDLQQNERTCPGTGSSARGSSLLLFAGLSVETSYRR